MTMMCMLDKRRMVIKLWQWHNDVFINQRDNGAHTATITLQGTQPTDLDLVQRGGTTQTYSLSQNCVTSGGCSISVTQGN